MRWLLDVNVPRQAIGVISELDVGAGLFSYYNAGRPTALEWKELHVPT